VKGIEETNFNIKDTSELYQKVSWYNIFGSVFFLGTKLPSYNIGPESIERG